MGETNADPPLLARLPFLILSTGLLVAGLTLLIDGWSNGRDGRLIAGAILCGCWEIGTSIPYALDTRRRG